MRRALVVAALVAIAVLAALGSPVASDAPDGLQRVARDTGFAAAEREHALEDGPLAGYSVDGVDDEDVATGVSGATGVFLAFASATGAFALLGRVRRRRRAGDGP